MDVFGGPAQEGGFEDAVRDGDGFVFAGVGLLEVQEGEVDVSLEVGWEPGF